ncbi:MAG: ferredoxin [Nanoarchaeota archaeon]|nr:ferredoxin [Nanoarchaeota archaeon]
MFIVKVIPEKCIGCAACTSVCDNFEMEDEKAKVKKEKLEQLTCEEDARNVCPNEAILIKREG